MSPFLKHFTAGGCGGPCIFQVVTACCSSCYGSQTSEFNGLRFNDVNGKGVRKYSASTKTECIDGCRAREGCRFATAGYKPAMKAMQCYHYQVEQCPCQVGSIINASTEHYYANPLHTSLHVGNDINACEGKSDQSGRFTTYFLIPAEPPAKP